MSSISFYHITVSGHINEIPDFQGATAKLSEEGYVWFDYRNPTPEELSELKEPLELHPLSIEDCINEIQVPKMDEFESYTFIAFNALYYSDQNLMPDEVDLFIGKNFIITVSGFSETTHNPLEGIRAVAQRNLPGIGKGPAWLLHFILDFIVDKLADTVEMLESEIDEAEEAILASPATFDASGLTYLRRNLFTLRKNLFHEREILVKISRNDCKWVPEKATMHYHDIYDHLSNFLEMTESHRDNVTSLMELYASMLNNQMARDSNQTNATVRRLTFITTIFMPLTLLAGIFGMSEWTNISRTENWHRPYLLFGIVMALISAASFLILKWMEKRDRKKLL